MPGLNKLFSLLCVLSLLWGGSAFASDGVLEINHACAINGGCFSGDPAGYPIKIDGSAGGSYRLTSNLVVPDENTNGISVAAPSISIDLNGFEIVRSGCEGATTDCKPESGSGVGVVMSPASIGGSVRNGSITGMGAHGVQSSAHQTEAKDLRLRWNRFTGVAVGHGSIVTGNTSYGNGGDGFRAGNGSVVSGNTAYDNGEKGIVAFGECLIQGNSFTNNAGFGMVLSVTDGYRENVISNNTLGTVSSGFNLGANLCDANDTCP